MVSWTKIGCNRCGFYNFRLIIIRGRTNGVIKHLLFNSRKTMKRIFKETCSLVNKKGACFQCKVLNNVFNGNASTEKELNNLNLARKSDSLEEFELYKLRVELVRSIDPLKSSGAGIFKALMSITHQVNQD